MHEKHHPHDEEALIYTDSHSLCTALKSQTRDTADLRKLLDRSEESIGVQWVPGHSELKETKSQTKKRKMDLH